MIARAFGLLPQQIGIQRNWLEPGQYNVFDWIIRRRFFYCEICGTRKGFPDTLTKEIAQKCGWGCGGVATRECFVTKHVKRYPRRRIPR